MEFKLLLHSKIGKKKYMLCLHNVLFLISLPNHLYC